MSVMRSGQAFELVTSHPFRQSQLGFFSSSHSSLIFFFHHEINECKTKECGGSNKNLLKNLTKVKLRNNFTANLYQLYKGSFQM